jgi:hypothetical protein
MSAQSLTPEMLVAWAQLVADTHQRGTQANPVGSVTGAVGSVTGAVGSVTGSIGSLGAQAKLDVNAEADTALTDYDGPTNAELATALATADDAVLAEVEMFGVELDALHRDFDEVRVNTDKRLSILENRIK